MVVIDRDNILVNELPEHHVHHLCIRTMQRYGGRTLGRSLSLTKLQYHGPNSRRLFGRILFGCSPTLNTTRNHLANTKQTSFVGYRREFLRLKQFAIDLVHIELKMTQRFFLSVDIIAPTTYATIMRAVKAMERAVKKHQGPTTPSITIGQK